MREIRETPLQSKSGLKVEKGRKKRRHRMQRHKNLCDLDEGGKIKRIPTTRTCNPNGRK